MEKAPRTSTPVKVEGAPGDQPLKVTLKLELGAAKADDYVDVDVEFRDEVRGESFSEMVDVK